MSTPPNPFQALGLPERPDLDNETVRSAWRAIAAATHPDRPDGGDLARYTQASAAYAVLRDPWGRSEAYADLREGQPDTTPCRPSPTPRTSPRRASGRCASSPPGSCTAGRCACSSAPRSPRCCRSWCCG
jgi:hypothetical protein